MRSAWWHAVVAFIVGLAIGAIAISLIPSSSCYIVVMVAVVIIAVAGVFFLSNRFKLI